MIRSALAIVIGYLVFGLSTALLFGVSGQDPRQVPATGLLVFFVAYGMAFAFLGGYLTALVASQYEAVHGLVLAGVLAVVALVSMILEWPYGSVWSQAAVLVLMAPAAALGARVRQRIVPFRHPSA